MRLIQLTGGFALALMETFINKSIGLDPATEQRLLKLDGCTLVINTTRPSTHVLVKIQAQRICLSMLPSPSKDKQAAKTALEPSATLEPNVTIDGSVDRLIALIINPQNRTGGNLKLSGDLVIINQLEKILTKLDIDWYEPLSRWLGDPITNKIEHLTQHTKDWAKNTTQKVVKNTQDYLNYEQTWFTKKQDNQAFKQKIDQVRLGQARIEQRIARLNQCIARM